MPKLIPTEQIARAILVLRGQRVLLDVELAALYRVAPKVLLQAVRRNRKRFPSDFMMQLSAAEWAALRSQDVTSNPPAWRPPLPTLRFYGAGSRDAVFRAE
jgi:ORF6N domain